MSQSKPVLPVTPMVGKGSKIPKDPKEKKRPLRFSTKSRIGTTNYKGYQMHIWNVGCLKKMYFETDTGLQYP